MPIDRAVRRCPTRALGIVVAVALLATPPTTAASQAGATAPTTFFQASAEPNAVSPQVVAAAEAVQDASTDHRWLGLDAEPLPLTDDEILDFLRTAEVVERKTIDIGINGIDQLVLEKDGRRMRAGFRVVDVSERDTRVGDRQYLLFRDSYAFECAAYRLARLLGMNNIPPTEIRTIDGVEGSVQLWLEGLFEDNNAVRPPNAVAWSQQISMMKFFDSLAFNVDRNPGNLLIDHRYRLLLIDHTRAFQRKSDPLNVADVTRVNRDVWERFTELDDEDFAAIFRGLLESAEIRFFLDRRRALIEHVQSLIAERGEGAVLF